MKRLTVVLAALICALFGPSLAFADEQAKRSALEVSASVASCMTERSAPQSR